MLNYLPAELLLEIYQLLEPKDLAAISYTQTKTYYFIKRYRHLFRKTPVLITLRCGVEQILVNVYDSDYSKRPPKNMLAALNDINSLECLDDFSIRSLIIEGSQCTDFAFIFKAISQLSLHSECSLTFKSIDFTDVTKQTVIDMIKQLQTIPLLRFKSCVFPSADYVSSLLIDTDSVQKSFRVEDEYCTISGNTTNCIGDNLLKSFIDSACDRMCLSLNEEVTFEGMQTFIQDWQDNPREFTAISFIRTEAFNEAEWRLRRGLDQNLISYNSTKNQEILLKLHVATRVHVWLSTQRAQTGHQ